MPLFCRGCSRFVVSPIATCGSCGYEHTRDDRASEDPLVLRRKHARHPVHVRGDRYRR